MHRYFVSYYIAGPLVGQFGFANAEIEINRPIRSTADVTAVTDKLIRPKHPADTQMVVLNYQPFDDDASAQDDDTEEVVVINREQLQEWAGRPLSDAEVAQLEDLIPNSSIPEAIATIVAECIGNPDEDAEDLPATAFHRGDLVQVEGWSEQVFRVTGHVWGRTASDEDLVSVAHNIDGGALSGNVPASKLTKLPTD